MEATPKLYMLDDVSPSKATVNVNFLDPSIPKSFHFFLVEISKMSGATSIGF